MTEIHEMGVAEMADAIRGGEITPTEIAETLLARIDTRLTQLADEFGDLKLLRAELAGTLHPDSPEPPPSVPVRFSRDGDHEDKGF